MLEAIREFENYDKYFNLLKPFREGGYYPISMYRAGRKVTAKEIVWHEYPGLNEAEVDHIIAVWEKEK